jgi:hypothetical protein
LTDPGTGVELPGSTTTGREDVMHKRVWLGIVIASVIGVALVGGFHEAGATPRTKQVAFRGSYAGRMDILLRPTGFQLVTYAKGSASVLRDSVLLGTGPTSQPRPACWTFEGVGSLIGSGGDRIYVEFAKRTGCASPGGSTFRSSGTATVLGGTGALSKAKGRLRISSSGNSITGAIRFSITGTLTY